MSDVVVPESVYEWRAPVSTDLARKGRFSQAVCFAGGIGLVVWGVASAATAFAGDARALIVVGLMLAGLGVLGAWDSRRLRSTVVRIDRMGTLTVSDARGSTSVDLRTVTDVAIRRRNKRPQWRWSIEAVARDGAWHAEIAAIATYWNLDETVIRSLETELRRWTAWANGGSVVGASTESSMARSAEPGDSGVRRPSVSTPVVGSVVNSPDAFVWRLPTHPNRARNRRRLRIGVVGFALAIAVFAAVSEWENGLTAVALSMFVPVLILVIGAGIDFFYTIGRRFQIGVDRAGLSIKRSSKEPLVIPAADVRSLAIELRQTHSSPEIGDASSWFLEIHRASGESVTMPIPSALGSAFGRNEAIALEAELRRRLGVVAA